MSATLITHHSSLITHHSSLSPSHLPNHGQDHRPPPHLFPEISFQLRPHFFLHHFDLAQLVGVALADQLHELCADLFEHFAAGVDVDQAAGDDLRVAHQPPARVEHHHHDHEPIFGQVLAV